MGLDLLGLPDQQRAQFSVVTERLQRPGNIYARRMIAAHHIDGDSCHYCQLEKVPAALFQTTASFTAANGATFAACAVSAGA
jgi:hypothetical protein